jgi:hypothetical protein
MVTKKVETKMFEKNSKKSLNRESKNIDIRLNSKCIHFTRVFFLDRRTQRRPMLEGSHDGAWLAPNQLPEVRSRFWNK